MKKIKALVALALTSTITFSTSIDVFADVDAYVAYDEKKNEYYQYNADELLESFRSHKRYRENDEIYLDFLDKLKQNRIDLIHDDSGKYVSYECSIKEFESKKTEFDLDKFSSEAEAVESPEYVYNRIKKDNKVVNELNLVGDGVDKDLSKKNQFEKYEDVRVTGNNVTISNNDIKGSLTLDPGENGTVFVKNIKADNIRVLSGGVNSIHLSLVEAGTMEVNSDDDRTRVQCEMVKIGQTVIRTYTVVDKVSGKVGTIKVAFNDDTKEPVVEFNGKFMEEIIVESSATLKTGKNAEIPKVKVEAKNKNAEINFDGTFAEIEVNKEAKINIAENSKISKKIIVQAQSDINVHENVKVPKLEIASKDSKAQINLSGNFSTVQINKESNVNIQKGEVSKMVLNADVNLKVNEGSNIKQFSQNGHSANLQEDSKKNIGEINPTPPKTDEGSKSSHHDNNDDKKEKRVIIESIGNMDIEVEEVKTIKVKTDIGAKINASVDKSSVIEVIVDGTNLKVKGLKEGEANVTVTASKNGYKSDSESFKVVVKAVPVSGITLKEMNKKLAMGGTYQIKAEVQPENATNKRIIWSTSNNRVAEVDENGLVKAVAEGEVDITAKTEDGSYEAVCKITVENEKIVEVEDISDIDLKVNEVKTIKVITNVGSKISASADKSDIVQVFVDGTNLKVKGLKEGETDITVTASKEGYKGDSETFKVVVKAVPVSGITLKEENKELVGGSTYQIKSEIQPENASNKRIIWSTSDDKVAEVDENGLVTAVAKGEADITAKTEDGSYEAVCKITVREQEIVPEIILNDNEVRVKIDSVKVGSSTVTIEILNKDNGNLEFMHEKVAENGVIEFKTNLKKGSYYAEINVVGLEKVVSKDFTVIQVTQE